MRTVAGATSGGVSDSARLSRRVPICDSTNRPSAPVGWPISCHHCTSAHVAALERVAHLALDRQSVGCGAVDGGDEQRVDQLGGACQQTRTVLADHMGTGVARSAGEA